MKSNTVTVRAKRQLTLPKDICDELGLKPGDRLALEIHNGVLVAKPAGQAVLDALEAISKALHEVGVTEADLLEGGKQVRDELFRERYPDLAAKYGV